MFPGKYQSDFAVQVTSHVTGAQQYTINFTNNNLLGSANFLPTYRTSKARVCVTVGMMSTGYDCPDILNLGLFRPIFSPTDFIQIKGRGTRKHDFREELFDKELREEVKEPQKKNFKLFDFFANCEYFEDGYDYDQVIHLPSPKPRPKSKGDGEDTGGGLGGSTPKAGTYQHLGQDILSTMKEEAIGLEGMKIDRLFYDKFEESVRDNPVIAAAVECGQWDRVIDYVNREVFGRPNEYFSLEKLRKATAVDRRLGLREILEKIFGLIPRFKSKDELLEEEFAKFVTDYKPEESDALAIPAIKTYFKAYATNNQVRHIIDTKQYTGLATNPVFSSGDMKAVPERYRTIVPNYIKDYVSLNQFSS
jgi:type I restriction enzyme R subunit